MSKSPFVDAVTSLSDLALELVAVIDKAMPGAWEQEPLASLIRKHEKAITRLRAELDHPPASR